MGHARVWSRLSGVLFAGLMAAGEAGATEGYFQYGYGARQKGLAGAGVADSRDATAVALNPAGLVHVDDQFAFSLTAFSPQREYEASGMGFAATGVHGSDRNLFILPNLAYARRLDADTVVALSIYGNGGINTRYPDSVFAAGVDRNGDGAPDGFAQSSAVTGVDLTQLFISPAVAHRWGRLSLGIAPILAVQLFEAKGLQPFEEFSNDPGKVTNHDHDVSVGGGVRAGLEYAAAPWLRFGIAGNSRIYMSEFESYAGLFAEQGDFDIPASLTAGVAIDVRPDLTVMFDYKRVWYSEIASVGNPSAQLAGCPNFWPAPGSGSLFPIGLDGGGGDACLGGDNGAGFGWNDIDIFKFGVEWRYNPKWTFRAGYAYNENPITSKDVTFNIIAPGVVQHHLTGGFKYVWSRELEIEFAAAFVPEASSSGGDPINPGQDITESMWQVEATLGAVWRLDAPDAPLEPLK